MTNKGKTLTVVDNEAHSLEVEAQVLGGSGYRVLPAGDLAEALRVAAATPPIHLLLTDFSLPDGDGFELAHRFRLAPDASADLSICTS